MPRVSPRRHLNRQASHTLSCRSHPFTEVLQRAGLAVSSLEAGAMQVSPQHLHQYGMSHSHARGVNHSGVVELERDEVIVKRMTDQDGVLTAELTESSLHTGSGAGTSRLRNRRAYLSMSDVEVDTVEVILFDSMDASDHICDRQVRLHLEMVSGVVV